ncbi:MAG: C40 family peptidase [Thermoflexibacter sp.]|jgi:hypothetical protein|nr:C40 family peptidase [Thermoflexibacter sp.]
MRGIEIVQDTNKRPRYAIIDLNVLQDVFDEFFGALVAGNQTRGVDFLKDDKGNVFKARIDLLIHQKTFDKFFSELIVKDIDSPITLTNELNNAPRNEKLNRLVLAARSFIGTPYKAAGDSVLGTDCSGFSFMCYKQIGISLPRTSRDQALIGNMVDLNNLQVGDLIFFATGSDPRRISHVGMIVKGGGKGAARMIHASSSRGVIEDDPFSSYYAPRFISATRVI